MTNIPLLVITGPTASGKTRRAVDVAKSLNGEIISADSRQVYRGMNLGTGKDLEEYDDIPYHLIDIANAGDKYNLYQYLRDYQLVYSRIKGTGHLPILCGGTGLYIESVLNGLILPTVPQNDELRENLKDKSLNELKEILSKMKVLHNTTDVDSCKRAIRAIEIQTYYEQHPQEAISAKPNPINNAVIIGVDIDRESRRDRITSRLKARLECGMVDEVKSLLDSGITPEDLIYYGLEYKYLTLYVTGHLTYCQMVDELNIAIHQFAKRQMTWFRGMEKRGFTINWLKYDMPRMEFVDSVKDIISKISK